MITGHEADAGEQAAAALRAETPDASVTFVHGEHATVGGRPSLMKYDERSLGSTS